MPAYKASVRFMYYEYIFPVCALYFSFCYRSSEEQTVLTFMYYTFISYSFIATTFCVLSSKLLTIPRL